MEKEKPSYYAIIPADVRYDSELKPMAKLMFGEITCLANKHGYCTASNQYFADLYGITVRNIQRLIKELSIKKYISLDLSNSNNGERKIYLRDTDFARRTYDKNVVTHDKNVAQPMTKMSPPPMTKMSCIIIQDNNNTRKNKDMSEVDTSNDPSSVFSKIFNEVEKEDLPEKMQPYLEISQKFQNLFIENLIADGIPARMQQRAKLKNVIDPIRLMSEVDGFSIDDLRDLYRFIRENKFWRGNVRSTGKLREKAQTLLSQYRNDAKVAGSKPLSMAEMLANASKR